MLEEEELAARPQHAPQLGERLRLIVDAAENERRDRRVERAVVERQLLGGRPHERRLRRVLLRLPLEPLQHRLFRLGDRERLDGDPVVLEVRAGATTDLEHAPVRGGQELPAALGEPCLLGLAAHAVIGRREKTASQAHVDASLHPPDRAPDLRETTRSQYLPRFSIFQPAPVNTLASGHPSPGAWLITT